MKEKSYDDFNTLIKECIKQLKESRICYCYTLEQVEEIQNKFSKELHIQKNECGYTLSIGRK